MHARYVEDPDGIRWIVARRWLLRLPRWRGFRFGVDHREPFWERALPSTRSPRRAADDDRRAVTRERVRAAARDGDRPNPVLTHPRPRRHQRSRRGAVYIDPLPGGWWGGGSTGGRGGGRSSGGGGTGSISRGGSGSIGRGGSGSITRSGSGSRSRGGGGGEGLAAGAGALGALGAVLKYALIVVAVIAAAAVVVFVLLPLAVFLVELLLFLLLTGLAVAWRAATGRAWVVEAREARAAPNVRAWRVEGFRTSRRVIDDVAEALRRGDDPAPAGAEPVTVVED